MLRGAPSILDRLDLIVKIWYMHIWAQAAKNNWGSLKPPSPPPPGITGMYYYNTTQYLLILFSKAPPECVQKCVPCKRCWCRRARC